jgi:hypothetical protein
MSESFWKKLKVIRFGAVAENKCLIGQSYIINGPSVPNWARSCKVVNSFSRNSDKGNWRMAKKAAKKTTAKKTGVKKAGVKKVVRKKAGVTKAIGIRTHTAKKPLSVASKTSVARKHIAKKALPRKDAAKETTRQKHAVKKIGKLLSPIKSADEACKPSAPILTSGTPLSKFRLRVHGRAGIALITVLDTFLHIDLAYRELVSILFPTKTKTEPLLFLAAGFSSDGHADLGSDLAGFGRVAKSIEAIVKVISQGLFQFTPEGKAKSRKANAEAFLKELEGIDKMGDMLSKHDFSDDLKKGIIAKALENVGVSMKKVIDGGFVTRVEVIEVEPIPKAIERKAPN